MQVSRIGIHPSVSGEDDPEKLRAALDGDGRAAVVLDDDPDEVDCDAAVTLRHREAFLDDRVGWVHLNSAGTDHFPLERYADRGTVVTNSSGIHRTAVGEHVLGLMLALAHELHTAVRNQGERRWEEPPRDAKFTVAGESVCVLGLGALGAGVAERADALGMDVVGVRRSGEPHPHADAVYGPDELHAAVSDVTFVVVALPLTGDTRGLIDAEALAATRSDAYLLNVGRGEIVDEAALVEALAADELAGAGLDVFEEEPLPEDSPLWEMDDVVVTPHRAGMFRDHWRAIADLVEEIAGQLAAGDPPRNRVA